MGSGAEVGLIGEAGTLVPGSRAEVGLIGEA